MISRKSKLISHLDNTFKENNLANNKESVNRDMRECFRSIKLKKEGINNFITLS